MSFCTAINCMDGRTQLPVIEFLKQHCRVDYVDMITEPGPVKILAEQWDKPTLESIGKRVAISLHKHHSQTIAVVAHHDCAGNPLVKNSQLEQLAKARRHLESQYPGVRILTLWVGPDWAVEQV